MIVVDANVVAYSLLEGDRSSTARAVAERDPEWRLPPIWRYEFANLLWLIVSNGTMKEAAAIELLIATRERFAAHEVDPDQGRAFRLAAGRSITAYDAQYVSLAADLGCLCVTEDGPLRRAVPELAVSMQAFLDSSHPSSGEGIAKITEKV